MLANVANVRRRRTELSREGPYGRTQRLDGLRQLRRRRTTGAQVARDMARQNARVSDRVVDVPHPARVAVQLPPAGASAGREPCGFLADGHGLLELPHA